MSGAISNVTQTGSAGPDTTRPATLTVNLARFGVFRAPVHRAGTRAVDPLILDLSSVEPGCRLQLLNLSANPNATWSDHGQELPSTRAQHLEGGRCQLIYGDPLMARLGLAPGDIFLLRQVDGAGNASDAVKVALSQTRGVELTHGWIPPGGTPRDHFEADAIPPLSSSRFVPAGDSRAPVALVDRLTLASGTAPGTATLSGVRAFEPGVTVTVHNERTNERARAVVDENQTLSVDIAAQTGDPLHVTAVDHNGHAVDLGVVRLSPPAASVPATPGAGFALQALFDRELTIFL